MISEKKQALQTEKIKGSERKPKRSSGEKMLGLTGVIGGTVLMGLGFFGSAIWGSSQMFGPITTSGALLGTGAVAVGIGTAFAVSGE